MLIRPAGTKFEEENSSTYTLGNWKRVTILNVCIFAHKVMYDYIELYNTRIIVVTVYLQLFNFTLQIFQLFVPEIYISLTS